MNVRGHRVCSSLSLESECQQRLARLLREQDDWFCNFQRDEPLVVSSFLSAFPTGDLFASEPSLERESLHSEFAQRAQRFSHLIRRSGVNAEIFRSLSHRPIAFPREESPSPFLIREQNLLPLRDDSQDLVSKLPQLSSVSFPNLKHAHSAEGDLVFTKSFSISQTVISSSHNVTSHSFSLQSQDFELASESEDDESSEDTLSIAPSDTISVHSEVASLHAPEDKERQQQLYRIALELVSTEQTYVSILYLLDQVFAFRVDQENRVCAMFPQEVLTQMFSILKALYKLHHDFFLPQLEDRISSWDTNPRIGDLLKSFAPFLKMYTDYVKNYDNAMGLINLWYQKEPRFAQIMDAIHALPECGHLTIQHHMLTPVQRIPRYELLLKDYLKKMGQDSADKEDTEKALELVSLAASHANDSMKKIDKFRELLGLQEQIGGLVDLASPTRELLKEGRLGKISARSGDHQERHVFLLTDLLLVCSVRGRMVAGPPYKVRARLPVDLLTLEEGDNLDTAHSFLLHTPSRSIELYAQTGEEKQEWMQVISKAIVDLMEKKSSLRLSNSTTKDEEEEEEPPPGGGELGKTAPHFVKLDSVQHCQVCQTHFSTFKRKHHCRACGKVCCAKCLGHKVPLEYDGRRSGKVCASCHGTLLAPPTPVHRSLLEPRTPAVRAGYLAFKSHQSRSWLSRWFALHHDFVLYSFRSHTEERALTSMPVPGYQVELCPDLVFKLCHKKRAYFFQATEKDDYDSWVSALEKASRAESPEERSAQPPM